jgi:glutaconate CoA-transferase subunit A
MKFMDLGKIRDYFRDGMTLALGGQSINMNPVGLVRELLRSGCHALSLIVAPAGGFAADLLIGAGSVKSFQFAQMGFWEYGSAPNMRRFVEEGRLTLSEHT